MRRAGDGVADQGFIERGGQLWDAEAKPSSVLGMGGDPLRAVWVTVTGRFSTAEPVLAVLGLIIYGSSATTLAVVEPLRVVDLTSRLSMWTSMWTSTETDVWPNLCATRVACAFGHCRDVSVPHGGVQWISRQRREPDQLVRRAGRTRT